MPAAHRSSLHGGRPSPIDLHTVERGLEVGGADIRKLHGRGGLVPPERLEDRGGQLERDPGRQVVEGAAPTFSLGHCPTTVVCSTARRRELGSLLSNERRSSVVVWERLGLHQW